MNRIQQIEAEEIAKAAKDIPVFRPGDTVRVGVKVIEGERTRVQNYEGVCIARSNKGMGSNFTVRKISFGEGVERVFPLYSPNIDSIEVIRKGAVRRAKRLPVKPHSSIPSSLSGGPTSRRHCEGPPPPTGTMTKGMSSRLGRTGMVTLVHVTWWATSKG